jgi:hypothetical protein
MTGKAFGSAGAIQSEIVYPGLSKMRNKMTTPRIDYAKKNN